MKKRSSVLIYLSLILISLIACSISFGPEQQSNQAPQQPEVVQEEQIPEEKPTQVPDVSYEGINFSYDDSIASDVAVENVPANPPDEMNTPLWEVGPAHVIFYLNGYPLSGTFHNPQIIIYPVEEFKQMNEGAANTIDALQQYLAYGTTEGNSLPFLPPFNACQVMHSNVLKMDFQNGTGVRYLTMYGQWIPPANNKDLFYTFQGITSDGMYYIAAILPVSHPNLPSDDSLPSGVDAAGWADMAEEYIANQAEMLNTQAANSFTPDLGLLDELIQSLLVH